MDATSCKDFIKKLEEVKQFISEQIEQKRNQAEQIASELKSNHSAGPPPDYCPDMGLAQTETDTDPSVATANSLPSDFQSNMSSALPICPTNSSSTCLSNLLSLQTLLELSVRQLAASQPLLGHSLSQLTTNHPLLGASASQLADSQFASSQLVAANQIALFQQTLSSMTVPISDLASDFNRRRPRVPDEADLSPTPSLFTSHPGKRAKVVSPSGIEKSDEIHSEENPDVAQTSSLNSTPQILNNMRDPGSLQFLLFYALSDKLIVSNKPTELVVTGVRGSEILYFATACKISEHKGRKRTNLFFDLPCVFFDDSNTPERKVYLCPLLAEGKEVLALFPLHGSFLYFVETKGGKTFGRPKQRYLLLKRNSKYVLAVPSSIRIVNLQLREAGGAGKSLSFEKCINSRAWDLYARALALMDDREIVGALINQADQQVQPPTNLSGNDSPEPCDEFSHSSTLPSTSNADPEVPGDDENLDI
jgi:hypothetical protein